MLFEQSGQIVDSAGVSAGRSISTATVERMRGSSEFFGQRRLARSCSTNRSHSRTRMKILILGGDGYLGWPTAMYFSRRGHDVCIVDNLSKRLWEAKIGVAPLFHLPTLQRRVRVWN